MSVFAQKLSNQIRSCSWRGFSDPGDTGFGLAEGQSITNLRLILRTGAVLRIEIEDQDQFITRGVFFRLSILDWDRLGVGTIRVEIGNPVVFATAVPPGVTTQLYPETPLVLFNEAGESLPMQYFGPPISVGSEGATIRLKAVPAIVNAASYWPGLPYGGGIASLFGTGLTNVRGTVEAYRLPLPTELAGTSITLGGTPLPIFSVANVNGQEQINFQMPPLGAGGDVVVMNDGQRKAFYTLPMINPGIFVKSGQPAILHVSGDFVSTGNPARKGEAIEIYGTGLGSTSPILIPGVAADVFSKCPAPIVKIAGQDAKVLFCGLAPGFVALNQVNVEVPLDAPSGLADLVIIHGGVPSNTIQLAIE